MSTAIYAFSGDPITFGHIDIVSRAAKVFDHVIVAIGNNSKKTYTFDFCKRHELASVALKHLKNVEVKSFHGLLVDFAYECSADVIIRGVRSFKDFDYENELFHINISQNKNIDTFFVISSQGKSHISSSAVKELQKEQGLIHKYVPLCVKFALEELSGQCIVGLTGGIASGKSYFGNRLSSNNYSNIHNIELDNIGHELLSGTDQLSFSVQQQVRNCFYDDFVAHDCNDTKLNRKVLDDIVFEDLDNLKKLNQIMYEPILIKLRRMLRDLRGLILLNGALLAEFDMSHLCNNNVIVIKTTNDTRRKRLLARNLNDEQIERRLHSQLSDNEKIHFLEHKIEQDNFGKLCIINNDNDDGRFEPDNLKQFFKDINYEII